MVAKKYQNPKGGLNAAGRKFFKRTTGANLKRPIKSGDSRRRASFLARMGASKGPYWWQKNETNENQKNGHEEKA